MSKIKWYSIFSLVTILVVVGYGMSVFGFAENDINESYDMGINKRIKQLSTYLVHDKYNINVKKSLSSIIEKESSLNGIEVFDSLTRSVIFSYRKAEDNTVLNVKNARRYYSVNENLFYEGSKAGEIALYYSASFSENNVSKDHQIRVNFIVFLLLLLVLLVVLIFFSYNAKYENGSKSENVLYFGSKRFSSVIFITMLSFAALSVGGGVVLIDENKATIYEKTNRTLYQSLLSMSSNLDKTTTIINEVSSKVIEDAKFQQIIKKLILDHDFNENVLIDYVSKIEKFADLTQVSIFDAEGNVIFGDGNASMSANKIISLFDRIDGVTYVRKSKTINSGVLVLIPIVDIDTGSKIAISAFDIGSNINDYVTLRDYDFELSGEIIMIDIEGEIISEPRFNYDKDKLEAFSDDVMSRIDRDNMKHIDSIMDYRGEDVTALLFWDYYSDIGFVVKVDNSDVYSIFNNFKRSVSVMMFSILTFSISFTLLTLYIGMKSNERVRSSRYEIIARLGHAAEFKDNDTGLHIKRISLYCTAICKHLPVSKLWSCLLSDAAPMHDIGKIGIPDSVLNKPGKLNEEEWELMRKHPQFGADIIGIHDSSLLRMAREIALYHHEKWDGSGYPFGLAGEDIPLSARILAVADVFDALTSVRAYKKAWELEAVIDLIQKESGSHFDPVVVEAFFKSIIEIKYIKTNYSD